MPEEKRLVLIDGHALAYRAYHALPDELRTSKGELTNAVYGFTSMLLKVLEDEEPTHIAITFDKGPTFRHEVYEEYKAHRAKMPDELRAQMDRIRRVVKTLDMPVYEQEGYEADDVLGTLARHAGERGVDTLIVTGDMDLLQLVDEHTRVLTSRWRFSDTVIYDVEGVRERYDGLEPEQLVAYKALMGDKSDNIPGVYGVGEKTATKLLKKYRTLDKIYEHLDEVSTRFRNRLEEGREEAFLSRQLARIVRDVPVTLDLEACRVTTFDYEEVLDLFHELEFKSLIERLPEPRSLEPAGVAHQLSMFGEQETGSEEARSDTGEMAQYEVIRDEEELYRLVARLKEAELLTVDTETTSVDAMEAELAGISITDDAERAYYVPVNAPAGEVQLPLDRAMQILEPLLSAPKIPKQGHNIKYDMMVLERHGCKVENVAFDTMIAEWLIDPASQSLGLKDLAWTRLHERMTPITDLIGTGRDQVTMCQVPVKRAAPYACADVDMTHRLGSILRAELKEKELWALYSEVEIPLVPVLAAMEQAGVGFDVEQLEKMSRRLAERLSEVEAEIHRIVGYTFNVNSPQQLSDALFKRLELPSEGARRTKTGHYSTAASVLERLQDRHGVVDLVLEYRSLSKLKSTYVDALPQLVNSETGRLHTSYNQTGTVTGRLSSSNPNLQNIPIRTELGRHVRRAFVAEEGCLLIAADYSQVELRVMAHVSGDEGLLGAFERGEDIHASTAAAIFDIPLEEVTPDQRRLAKSVNFGLSFGQTAYGLAQATGLTHGEAENFIETYFERFPAVRQYIQRTKVLAARRGHVETLQGRRRYFPELQPTSKASHYARQAAERMAINAPIQGTAADIIKIAMVRLDQAFREHGMESRMILQVHDELIVEAPEHEVGRASALICEIMEGAFELDAPLKVDLKIGQNWEEMEPLTMG